MKISLIIGITVTLIVSSCFNKIAAQNNSVWGSVENIEELLSSDAYLNLAKLMSLTEKQILPSSKNPMLLKVYEFSCNCNEADLYTAVTQTPGILGVEYGPNFKSLVLPNDYNTEFPTMYALDLINAEQAWESTHGDPNIILGISDQNYDVTHEELVGNYIYYDTLNALPSGHGTAVSITAAGNTDNGVGLSSIGRDLRLGLYRMNYNEVLIAANAGSKVINMSWTSGCEFNIYHQMAIDEACGLGAFLIAAAGNGSTCGGPDSLVYPAAYDNVFAVTSIGPNDNHEKYIGNPNSTHQHNITVDLSAPGYDIPTSAAPGVYELESGTSFAAPYVTGTVGLMLSVNPCMSNPEIENILKLSSVDIDALNPLYAGLIGAGRLDAGAAVEMAFNSATNTNPCPMYTNLCEGILLCDPSQSAYAGPCQTVFWGYTDDYATVELNGLTSGGNGVTTSTWTDQDGNLMGTGNSISFLSDASSVSTAEFITNTYTLTHTDEFGCSVSSDVNVIVYNVKCPNPSGNPKAEKIIICGKEGRRCVPYNAVENILAACSGCSLGPCNAISNCKSNTVSNEFETPSIKIYPNPSKGIINIRTEENQVIDKIEIYNHIGQLIETQSNRPFFTVDITKQKGGIFLIKAYFGNQVKSTIVSYL